MAGAIILAAGAGSRLSAVAPLKPLVDIRGTPLIGWVIDALLRAGVGTIAVVTGYRADALEAYLATFGPDVSTVHNPDWERAPNGVSLLAAASRVREGTFLAMADHLLSETLIRRFIARSDGLVPVSLAVDRRLGHPDVDESDVTRVRTEGGRIRAIGKALKHYDCYDTGLFRVGSGLVRALATLPAPTLSEGVGLLAARSEASAVDIGDGRWLDIDDPSMLERARSCWDAR
jgi:choline kinase